MLFRAEEVFDLFVDEINQYRLRTLMPSGLVLTGGGALIPGIKELAEERLGMQVRVGYPTIFNENNKHTLPDALRSPIYSTALAC